MVKLYRNLFNLIIIMESLWIVTISHFNQIRSDKPTCENGFVGLELSTTDRESHITKLLDFKELSEIIRKSTFRNFKLYSIGLSRYVNTIGYNAHLKYTKVCYKILTMRNSLVSSQKKKTGRRVTNLKQFNICY